MNVKQFEEKSRDILQSRQKYTKKLQRTKRFFNKDFPIFPSRLCRFPRSISCMHAHISLRRYFATYFRELTMLQCITYVCMQKKGFKNNPALNEMFPTQSTASSKANKKKEGKIVLFSFGKFILL
jgi:hypothetical protein